MDDTVHATRSVRSGGQLLIPDSCDACGAITSRDSHLEIFGMIDNHKTHVN